MATYTHFGKQPDVLKHLILCEVLRNEHPQVYVETNSACAIYPMQQTSEQQYGIYYFLEKTAEEDNQVLKDSIYYKIESAEMQINPEKPDVPLNKNDAFQKVQKRRVQEKR